MSSILQFLLLLILFYRKVGDFGIRNVLDSFRKILFAGLASGAVVFFVLRAANLVFNTEKVIGILIQTFMAGFAGILFYLFISRIMRYPELDTIINSFKKQFRRGVASAEIEIIQS